MSNQEIEMPPIYSFSTHEEPGLDQVGGKAFSLIEMTRQGFLVPPGFVLAVSFFQPWLERVYNSLEWKLAFESTNDNLKAYCEDVKKLCLKIDFDSQQRQALGEAIDLLVKDNDVNFFAVRSSSPEEDLERLSFAGEYLTLLGVNPAGIEEAIRRAFASCFDERVIVYKLEHGLSIERPTIAVIVQAQVAASTSGVAFSLNPLNNCYDEAVVNANFGLGESVVSGQITPDTFIVDKIKKSILDRSLGKKESSVWLSPSGGTYQNGSSNSTKACLSDQEAIAIVDLLVSVEEIFQKPIDIEWAYENDQLYLLQARPITAYVPLPPELITKPGEQKNLYFDMTLVKWGMPDPLSVMGMDYIDIANIGMMELSMGGDWDFEKVRHIRPTFGGRTYGHASNSMKFQGRKNIANNFHLLDASSAEIFTALDEIPYLPKTLPPALKGILFKALKQNISTFWVGWKALRNPDVILQKYKDAERDFMSFLQSGITENLPMAAYAKQFMDGMLNYIKVFMAMLLATEIARSSLKRLFKHQPKDVREKVVYLERALPNNITIEMGLLMYQLAQFEEIKSGLSSEEFLKLLEKRDFSPEFLEAWETFMDRFGFRGPMEMDPAAKRFIEQPARIYEQLCTMASTTDEKNNPMIIHDRAKAQRITAYNELLEIASRMSGRKAKSFEKNYQVLMAFGGFRETPKYYYVMITNIFRQRALRAAKILVEQDRLDESDQIFNLTLDQFDSALQNDDLDLRALIEENTRYLRKLRFVKEFPRVIDSRGKILRPPRKEAAEGEMIGEPISPGIVSGQIKVLHEPNEKPVLPGEILVAQATDPGWTPLFINASGIILEVGGVLQHGALVAREYGKPCVAGIQDATSQLSDGQIVELDGTNGVVRLI